MTAVAAPEVAVVETPPTPPSPVSASVQDQPPAPVTAVTEPVAVVPPAAPAAVESATLLTGAKPDTTALPSETTAPVTFALALPEGSHLDPAALERISAVAKAIDLKSPEHAQAILDAANAEVTAHFEALTAATAKGGTVWQETVKTFTKDALADPEIGGTREQLERTVGQGARVLAKYDPDGAFREFLDATGYGSHKTVLKMFTRLHHALGDDHFVQADRPAAPPPKSLAERVFPNMKQE